MGIDDKANNEFENASGKMKEGFGKATNNEDLEAEGKGEQLSAKAKNVGESVKDFAQEAGDKIKGTFKKD